MSVPSGMRTWSRKASGRSLLATPEFIENRIEPDPTSGCLLWIGAHDGQGYGQLYGPLDHKKRSRRKVHRYLWEQQHGLVPAGFELDHRCRVRSCVNLLHLRVVTHADNMANSRKYCRQGHPLELLTPRDSGQRCRICRQAWKNEYTKRI